MNELGPAIHHSWISEEDHFFLEGDMAHNVTGKRCLGVIRMHSLV